MARPQAPAPREVPVLSAWVTEGVVVDATPLGDDAAFIAWRDAARAAGLLAASDPDLYITVDHGEGLFHPSNPDGMPQHVWDAIIRLVGVHRHAVVRIDLE